MKTVVRVIVATALTGLVAVVSPRVFVLIILMAASVLIATIIEFKDAFRGTIVFHRCCSTVHWIFISFYVFTFDGLWASRIGRLYLFGAILISIVLYGFATVNTYRILQVSNHSYFGTKDEKRSVYLAIWSLLVVLGFAIFAE
jgi:hypothetical protein